MLLSRQRDATDMLTTINGPQYMSDICHGPIYSLGRLCGAICREEYKTVSSEVSALSGTCCGGVEH